MPLHVCARALLHLRAPSVCRRTRDSGGQAQEESSELEKQVGAIEAASRAERELAATAQRRQLEDAAAARKAKEEASLREKMAKEKEEADKRKVAQAQEMVQAQHLQHQQVKQQVKQQQVKQQQVQQQQVQQQQQRPQQQKQQKQQQPQQQKPEGKSGAAAAKPEGQSEARYGGMVDSEIELWEQVRAFVEKKEKDNLRELFDYLDKDGSGGVTLSELFVMLRRGKGGLKISEHQAGRVQKGLDLNGDGTISYREFTTALAAKTAAVSRAGRERAMAHAGHGGADLDDVEAALLREVSAGGNAARLGIQDANGDGLVNGDD